MANYKHIIPFILQHEGKFSANPNDLGGATMCGITLNTFRQYYGQSKTVDDLRHITNDQWERIFLKGYWQPLKLECVNDQRIADILADWAFMSGITQPAKTVQALIGVKADGKVGPITITAINNANPQVLLNRLYDSRVEFYKTICAKRPANRVFYKGWLNRLNDLMRYEAVK